MTGVGPQGLPRGELLCRLQRLLLPHQPMDAIDALLRQTEAEHPGWKTGATADGIALYDSITVLNELFYESPACSEAGRPDLLAAEQALFATLSGSTAHASETRTYQIRQIHRLVPDALPERAALHLFIPVPRLIPGLQDVRLVGAVPHRLADHAMLTAGQLHGVPILIEPRRSLPTLEVEFVVEQTVPDLFERAIPGLDSQGAGQPADLTEPVIRWLTQERLLEAPPRDAAAAAAQVEAILDAMEAQFEYAVLEDDPTGRLVAMLPALRFGNLLALSEFVVAALRQCGLAAQVGAGELLHLRDRAAVMRYPGSFGYRHAYVRWAHPASGAAGQLDLSYFGRWAQACTEDNTPDVEQRTRMAALGALGRSWLRRAIYPLDAIPSARVPPSLMVNLDGGESWPIRAPVDTEITARRIAPGEGRP